MASDGWLENPTGKIAKGTECPHCARYNSRNVCGHALVVRAGKVLLVKREIEPMKGWWALPAGYLDWDESLEECALRELEEEARLKGKIKGLVGVYSDPRRDEDGRQNVAVVYEVEALGEAEKGEEVSEVGWFGLDELPEKIAFDHRRIIEDFVRRQKKE